MQIREVGTEESSTLLHMDQICFSRSWSLKDWESVLSKSQYQCYLAIEDEICKGFLLISMASDEGEVLKIGVLPEFRRQNIGRRMLDKALIAWENSGIVKMYLEVRQSNQAAIHLYTGMNFHEAGVRKNYYRDPKEDAIVYTRDL